MCMYGWEDLNLVNIIELYVAHCEFGKIVGMLISIGCRRFVIQGKCTWFRQLYSVIFVSENKHVICSDC